MRRKSVLKGIGAAFLTVAILAGLGFLAFVPFPKEDGYAFVTSWGRKGTAPGEFNDPTGIAVAGAEVFVSDSRNGRIQVFDLDGNFLRTFGRPGTAIGELGRPMNLTVRDGEI